MINESFFETLELEITHRCNKNCPLCDHRIKYSDFDYLSVEEYKYIEYCLEEDKIKTILLIGGEPLMHPNFAELSSLVLKRCPVVSVSTNGKLLPTLPKELFQRLRFVVQEYPGFNDDIVRDYKNESNVRIEDYKGTYNPYIDPNLSESEARKIRQGCLFQTRLVGLNLYGCCLSESIERYYKTDAVHIKITKNWKNDFSNIETYKACQHCFRAIHKISKDTNAFFGNRLRHDAVAEF